MLRRKSTFSRFGDLELDYTNKILEILELSRGSCMIDVPEII